MDGEAIIYVSDFLNSSMIKYDKVSIYTQTRGQFFFLKETNFFTILFLPKSRNTNLSRMWLFKKCRTNVYIGGSRVPKRNF